MRIREADGASVPKGSVRALVLLVVAAVVLAACGGGEDDQELTASPTGEAEDVSDQAGGNGDEPVEDVSDQAGGNGDEPVEVTIWFGRDDFVPGDEFESFYEEHPNIRVNWDVIPMEDAPAQFLRSLGSAGAPDIFQTFGDSVGVLAEEGNLRDMTDMFSRWESEDPELWENLLQTAFDPVTWNGKPYGISPHIGAQWIIYRPDWYEEAGLSHPPETWADILEASRAIVDQDSSRVGFSMAASRATDPFLWFMGTPFYAMGGEVEEGVPQLESEAGIYLIEWFQTLVSEGLTAEDVIAWGSDEMRAQFLEGEAGHLQGGRNLFTQVDEALGGYQTTWDAIMPPLSREGEPDSGRFVGRGFSYYVSGQTEVPYEASLVLRYLMEPEIGLEIALRYNHHTNVETNRHPDLLDAQPWLADLEDEVNAMVGLPAHPNQVALGEVLKDLLHELIQNPDKDAAALAAEYQERLNETAEGD